MRVKRRFDRRAFCGILALVFAAGMVAGCKTTQKLGNLGGDLFQKGGVRIRTEPSGAKITINEQPVGRAPVMEPLKAGTYRVVAKKRGYEPQEQWVDVPKGKTVEVVIKFHSGR